MTRIAMSMIITISTIITMTTTYCDDLTGRKAVFAGEAYTALPKVRLKIKIY